MSYTIKFSKKALIEYSDAFIWYAEKSEGLEKRFEKASNDQLEFIALHPEAGSPYRHLRGRKLKKFPYKIYYSLDNFHQVATIVA
jgi:plasmid stabilization system protein ParE